MGFRHRLRLLPSQALLLSTPLMGFRSSHLFHAIKRFHYRLCKNLRRTPFCTALYKERRTFIYCVEVV